MSSLEEPYNMVVDTNILLAAQSCSSGSSIKARRPCDHPITKSNSQSLGCWTTSTKKDVRPYILLAVITVIMKIFTGAPIEKTRPIQLLSMMVFEFHFMAASRRCETSLMIRDSNWLFVDLLKDHRKYRYGGRTDLCSVINNSLWFMTYQASIVT